MEEINESLKENQEKPVKRVKKTVQIVQDLKTEIVARRKRETEEILEIENLGELLGTTN